MNGSMNKKWQERDENNAVIYERNKNKIKAFEVMHCDIKKRDGIIT